MKQLIVTCLPSFYKNLAFRKLMEHCQLNVFFTNRSPIKRDNDFFKYELDSSNVMEYRGFFNNLSYLYRCAKDSDFVILGGWDDIYFWFLRIVIPRHKLKVIVESSIYELRKSSWADILKRFFLKGISECIVSGQPHERLVRALGFDGTIKRSLGVGLLDFPYLPVQKSLPLEILNFLYIGRISKAKGLDLLLDFFDQRTDLSLNLVGSIDDDNYVKRIEGMGNVCYLGYRKRDELKDIFDANDVFLLASKSETWGLVVEEALYHGLPVIVSDKVGCNEDCVIDYGTGIVFKLDNLHDFTSKMEHITNLERYNFCLENIQRIDFNQKNDIYVNSFI